MFKEKVNAQTDARTDGLMARRTTDNRPWHKLAGLRPVELKTDSSFEWIYQLSNSAFERLLSILLQV